MAERKTDAHTIKPNPWLAMIGMLLIVVGFAGLLYSVWIRPAYFPTEDEIKEAKVKKQEEDAAKKAELAHPHLPTPP